MHTKKPYAAATNGIAGVVVTTWLGIPSIWSTTESYNTLPRDAQDALFERAANKLGFKRDRRFKGGWRNLTA